MSTKAGQVHRIASVALITAGAVIALDVGLTLAWAEPMSTLQGWLAQRQADDQLEQLEEAFAAPRPNDKDEPSVGQSTQRLRRETNPGDPIGRLLIPAIDLNIVAVEGTDTATLKKGPGHYPETALPGQGATVAIAGHRTTYLAPFRRINELGAGDEIELKMPYATFTYRFEKQRIVDPYRVGVVRDVGSERLVLTACHPLYSAAQRIVVFAGLTGVDSNRGGGAGRGRGDAGSSASDMPAPPPPGLGPVWAGVGGLGLIVLLGFSVGARDRRTQPQGVTGAPTE